MRRLANSHAYAAQFKKLFAESRFPISIKNVGVALACFERELNAQARAAMSARLSESPANLNPSIRRGEALFRGKAGCANCHLLDGRQPPLTDGQFHRRGINPPKVSAIPVPSSDVVNKLNSAERDNLVASNSDQASLGRYLVTGVPSDIGKFRTPSLWSVGETPPYMHDGSVETLEDAIAIEAYYRAEEGSPPIILSAPERADIASFLRSLQLRLSH